MTKEEKYKGINDPWRLYTRKQKSTGNDINDVTIGAPGSIHPLDADLLPQRQYVFRHTQATGDLLVQGADDQEGAAKLLLSVIHNVPSFKKTLEHAGFTYGSVKTLRLKGFIIKAGDYALCLPAARSTASGLSRLVDVIKQSAMKTELRKAGIIPLLK